VLYIIPATRLTLPFEQWLLFFDFLLSEPCLMFEGEKKETIRVLRDSIFYNKVETTTFYFLYHKRNNESSSRLQIILPIIDVNTISAPNVSFCFF